MSFKYFLASMLPISLLVFVSAILLLISVSKSFQIWMLDEKMGTRPLIIFGTPYLVIEILKLIQTFGRVVSPGIEYLDFEPDENIGWFGIEGILYHNNIWLGLLIFFYGWSLRRRFVTTSDGKPGSIKTNGKTQTKSSSVDRKA